MNKTNTVTATCQEQPTLLIKSLSKEDSCIMMRELSAFISNTLFGEGSQASVVKDNTSIDCLFTLPSGNQVRIMTKIREDAL